jgi:hypothetical protein
MMLRTLNVSHDVFQWCAVARRRQGWQSSHPPQQPSVLRSKRTPRSGAIPKGISKTLYSAVLTLETKHCGPRPRPAGSLLESPTWGLFLHCLLLKVSLHTPRVGRLHGIVLASVSPSALPCSWVGLAAVFEAPRRSTRAASYAWDLKAPSHVGCHSPGQEQDSSCGCCRCCL